MKKVFFAALLTLTVAVSAFAADVNKENRNAATTFKYEFKNASNVSWTINDDFTKVSFTLNDQKMEAFYNVNGEKIAMSKSITLDELPLSAKRSFAKSYQGYTVKEAISFEGIDESALYISAENEKESVILEVSDNNNLTLYKRTRK